MQEEGWSPFSSHAIYFATRSKIHPRAYSAKQGYNCTIPRGFPTFHANRGLPHIAPYLQSKTRSIKLYSSTWVFNFPRKSRSIPHRPLLTARNEIYNYEIYNGST